MKEFKIIEFKKQKTYETVEKALAERSAEGWETVSMTVDVSSDLKGVIVVLLQREIKNC